mmetsp:Transcript_7621/g.8610  ORF Transcript_7621/g.8610 Transcript_7621/m.8610 type:complete len:163 (-) Transcript_7621:42-530(-)
MKKHEAKVKKKLVEKGIKRLDRLNSQFLKLFGFIDATKSDPSAEVTELSKILLTRTGNDESQFDMDSILQKFQNIYKCEYEKAMQDKDGKDSKMDPADFAAVIIDVLNEKLTSILNKTPKQSSKHNFDHINTNLIFKQKDQILKKYKEPINKILSLDKQSLL